ncbi:prolyl oligopeptidase family serine peptidase [Mammaliicoccus sciuri]|uniref:prolyl oligopeptidase family serine peptidase n=1 Tax=Mammaliicoccus sciuri TaxID=1296 RepID=UPI002B260625|nr:prolyl oligopeptidase family serine peptidase [Mammaliicoccus sciuri]MEB6262258.1 S9 family peptidase [Mammaliicoccus sciuri]WQK57558.1 prolyl oligopeptidase family serine peptidase [Mammaliicoccus sciuri]
MININFENLDFNTLLNSNNKSLIITKDNEEFYFKIHLKNTDDNIVVFSNGAVDPEKKEPPIFMRESWVNDMDYSAIFIDDKTIHNKNLKIGWGIGTKERHYLKDYSEIIKKIVHILDIENRNIFYYGSSAGGFMSIALATMHSETTAIVNNPQTYVYNYYKTTVDALYEAIFPGMIKNDIQKEFSARLSITSLFRVCKRTPKIYYIQNRLSKFDMDKHLNPFIKMLDKYGIDSTPINFILYNDKSAGHNPLSKEKTLEFIELVIRKSISIL